MIDLKTLRALAPFREYDERDLAVLLGSSQEREYAPSQTICSAGERGHSCFVVASGEVEVLRVTPEGPLSMGRYGAGMFLGVIAFVDGGARTTTARALTHVAALEFTRDVFDALLRAHSPLALRFQRQIAVAGIRKLRGATAQLLELLSNEARDDAPSKPATTQTRDVLRYIQGAVDEWGIPMEDVTVKPTTRVATRPFPSARPSSRGV